MILTGTKTHRSSIDGSEDALGQAIDELAATCLTYE